MKSNTKNKKRSVIGGAIAVAAFSVTSLYSTAPADAAVRLCWDGACVIVSGTCADLGIQSGQQIEDSGGVIGCADYAGIANNVSYNNSSTAGNASSKVG